MSQNWIFVINNPEPEEVERLMVEPANWNFFVEGRTFLYICIGLEVGGSGTMHLQGYAQFAKKLGMKAVQKAILPERPEGVHVEKRRGSHQQAVDYIADEDKEGSLGFVEWGEGMTAGERMDLNQIGGWLAGGMTPAQIYQEMKNDHWGAWKGCYKAIETAFQFEQEAGAQEWMDVDVTVLFGPAGTGKSKRVHAKTTMLSRYKLMTDTNPIWFDRYRGQPDLVIEEFRTRNMSLEMLLTLLEGLPRLLPVKGGTAVKNWTRVFITSNKPPHLWYGPATYVEHGDPDVLKRRINHIYKVTGLGDHEMNEVGWGDE